MSTQSKGQVAQQILRELDRVVLSIGELLDSVYDGPEQFEQFVLDNLPLQPPTAERIRAMWAIHLHRPNDPELPEPWKALWSLPG